MEEFPPNTKFNKEKEEPKPEKNLEKIVSGEVVKRKKPLGRRFKDLFFGKDFKYAVIGGVMIPAFKNLVFETGQEALRRMLFQGDRDPRVHRRPRSDYNPRISYDRIGRDPQPRGSHLMQQSRGSQGRYDLGELIIPSSREDAEMVLDKLRWVIDQYDVVSVGDLYELLGVMGAYTDNKWGWTNLVNAEVRQVREGWLIDLPDPEPI